MKNNLLNRQFPYNTVVAIIIILLLATIMISIVQPGFTKPYIMDEMEFPSVARAIAETGQPVYYRGEVFPRNVGLWHPPLYIAWYAAWMKLFGSSIPSGRIFGLVNAILSLSLITWFVLVRSPQFTTWRDRLEWGAGVLCGLGVAATSPIFLQGSILPDIDTQALPLTLTAMFIFLFELYRRSTRFNPQLIWTFMVCLILMQLYTKLSTIFLIVPTLIVYTTLSTWESTRNWINILISFAKTVAAIGTGLGLMAGSWWVIAKLWNVNFALPFTYLRQSSNNPLNFGGSNPIQAIISSIPGNFSYYVYWVGIPLIVMVVISALYIFQPPKPALLIRSERAALCVFFITLTLLYVILRPAPFEFPKYWPPIIPIASLLAIDIIFIGINRFRYTFIIITAVSFIAYLLYARLNPMMDGVDFIYSMYYQNPQDKIADIIRWQILPLAFTMTGAVIIVLLKKHSPVILLATASLIVTLGWQISVVQKQAQVQYSTTYLYGEQSLAETVNYLRANLPLDTVVIAPKDVGFPLQDRWKYIELDTKPQEHLMRSDVAFLIMRSNDYYGNTIRDTPEIMDILDRDWTHVVDIKNFRIMQKTSSLSR